MKTRSQSHKEIAMSSDNRSVQLDTGVDTAQKLVRNPECNMEFVTSITKPSSEHSSVCELANLQRRSSGSVRSSRSTATIVARKLAAEARFQRRLFEREREVEKCELQAEIAAIEAEHDIDEHNSHQSGSVERTTAWVNNEDPQVHDFFEVDRGILATRRDTCVATLPGGSPRTTNQGVAPYIHNNKPTVQSQAQVDVTSKIMTVPMPINESHNLNYVTNRDEHFIKNVTETCSISASLAQSQTKLETRSTHKSCAPSKILNDDNHATLTRNELSEMLHAISDTASAAKSIAMVNQRSNRPKHVELPIYSGGPQQWLQFKRTFNDTKSSYSSVENIARLQNTLRGAAKEAVSSLLIAADGPEIIMETLEQSFARPEMIILAELSSLKNLPKLNNYLKDLLRRSDWKKSLRLADHFWSRWIKEVMPTTQPRPPEYANDTTFNIGDVVLIVDETYQEEFGQWVVPWLNILARTVLLG